MENLIVVIGFIIVCLILLKQGYKAKVSKMLLYLVIRAEEEFGAGTGKLKYHAVTTWIYDKLPSLVTFLFTDKQIDQMIEGAVEDMKKYLGSNVDVKAFILD